MILRSAEAQDGGRDAMLARLRDAGWVKDESTFDQPHPCASGIPHVMVNGVLAAEAGRHDREQRVEDVPLRRRVEHHPASTGIDDAGLHLCRLDAVVGLQRR